LISVGLAAGKLLGLSVDQMEQAVNLALNPHQAMRQARAGELSMWKGAAFANTARNAVFAAMLASYGMTGPAPIFEGVFGFCNQVSGPFELSAMGGTDEGFMLPRTYIKHFPVEYHAQVAVELALDLHAEGLRAPAVEQVTLETFRAAVEIIAADPEKWAPRTRETADHSLPYCFAVALLDGAMTPAQFEADRIAGADVRDLLALTRVVENAELTAKYPDGIPTVVRVRLTDGREITRRRDYALGHPENPMSDGQVEAKFRQLCGSQLIPARAAALLDRAWHLDELWDLTELLSLTHIDADE
jgi:2-methylcitrate dehydratase